MVEFNRSLSLSPNFMLGEFIQSSSYPSTLEGIVLTDVEIQRLYLLCLLCLQPIRDHFGDLRITSAFRTPRLNRLVNGSSDSQHCLGEAADFIPLRADPLAVYLWAHNSLRWKGELIYYESERRLHVALPRLGVKSDHFVKHVRPVTIPV